MKENEIYNEEDIEKLRYYEKINLVESYILETFDEEKLYGLYALTNFIGRDKGIIEFIRQELGVGIDQFLIDCYIKKD